MESTNALKSAIRRRIKIGVMALIGIGIFSSLLYLWYQWQFEKKRADFYATIDLSDITNENLPAATRLQTVYWAAAAAEKNKFGLIADALQQFEAFENKMLSEQQAFTARDTIAGMVFIPEGPFLFGGFGQYVGEPLDTTLAAFYIDKYPVTNREFCQFLNDAGNRMEDGAYWYQRKFGHIDSTSDGFKVEAGFERHPVVSVSWYGARAYARWVGKRLATEHEWEKAARGMLGRLFPWGSVFDWEKANTASYWAKRNISAAARDHWYEDGGARISDTTPVDQFPEGVSPYGCYDMCGNVWEWTSTRAVRLIRKEPRYINRGGAFSYGVEQVRTAFRGRGHPGATGSITGFRCARNLTD